MIEKKNQIFILIILAVLFIAIRVIDIDRTLGKDESVITTSFTDNNFPITITGNYCHPMFNYFPLAAPAFIFGPKEWAFRIASLLFSIITAIMLYLYLNKKFGFKYAALAILFMSLLPWEINSATQIVYTATMTLFGFISLIFAEKYVETNKKKYFVYFTLSSFIATMTAFTGIIIFITILIYLFLKKGYFKNIKELIVYSISYLSITSLGIYINYLLNPQTVGASFSWALRSGIGHKSIIPYFTLSAYVILLLWAGPFLLISFYIILRKMKLSNLKNDIHLLYVILASSVFIFLNSDPYRPFDRYFAFLIPSLIILIITYGKDIIDEIIKKWKLFLIYVSSALFTFIILNMFKHKFISLEPKITFIKEFFLSFGMVYVPYSSNGGPLGFYVPGSIIFISWIIIVVLLLLALFIKNNKKLIVIIFAIMLSFNIFVSIHQTNLIEKNNPTRATELLLDNMDVSVLHKEVYLYFNSATQAYIPRPEYTVINAATSVDLYNLIINKSDYSVILVDFPHITENDQLWGILNNCEIIYFSDKYNIKSYIYNC